MGKSTINSHFQQQTVSHDQSVPSEKKIETGFYHHLIRLNHRTFSGTHIGVQYAMHSPLNFTWLFHSFLRLCETFKLVQL